MDDQAAIMYSFCARLYGQRRAKRKAETIVKQLTGHDAVVAAVREGGEDATR